MANATQNAGHVDSDVQEDVRDDERARDSTGIRFHGGPATSVVPLCLFVVWAVFQTGVLGISSIGGLAAGMVLALGAGLFLVRADRGVYANAVVDGMSRRTAATAVVAWLWAGMFAKTLLVGDVVGGVVWVAQAVNLAPATFPAVTFLLSGALTVGIGTGYGSIIALTALLFPAGVLLGANPVLLFGAILSGAVLGDNLAPVSDTTVVSAVTQNVAVGDAVAARVPHAAVAGVASLLAYLLAGHLLTTNGTVGASGLPASAANPIGLVHLVSIGVVIAAALRGKHVVEAVSLGLIVAVAANLVFGLAAPAAHLAFTIPQANAGWATGLPVVLSGENPGLTGSLVVGVTEFFPLAVLTLLISAGAEVATRGGGMDAIQEWLLTRVATTARRAETSMVLGVTAVNAALTINTAAAIAVAPLVRRVGEQTGVSGIRRANVLDAATAAPGYIFPWAGGVLVGYAQMPGLVEQYGTEAMLVNPVDVWPFVFHGWLLVSVFLLTSMRRGG